VFCCAVEWRGYAATYTTDGRLCGFNIPQKTHRTIEWTYDNAHACSLPFAQALPYRHSRQLDRMVHIDIDLFVALVLLRVLPKVRKRRIEQASADPIGIGYIVPFLLARIKHFGEIRPVRDIRLHIEDVVFALGERIEI
jgi:hypothetical protein